MRIGFVGPARGNVTRFRELCELLLFDLAVDRVVYLGADDTLDRAVKGWAAQLGAPADDVSFLTEVALLAPDAPPDVLDDLLTRDGKRQRLADIAGVPDARDRCVEMIEGRVLLMVYDRAVLDEDDITNATVVVYGDALKPDARVIGPRGFLTPGGVASLGGAHVAVVEGLPAGLRMALHDARGRLTQELVLSPGRASKMEVRST